MRVSGDAVLARPRVLKRYQLFILVAVTSLALLFICLQAIANAYTNYLWYRSINLTMIWRSMVETKLALDAVFCGSFFLACWFSLLVVDRVAIRTDYFAPEFDIVRRYQNTLGYHRVAVRTVASLVLALAVGVGASNQWQHWLLFVNHQAFPGVDPQFGRNVGFFVFRLPFLSFLVDWSLLALLVLLIVTCVAYYLNGGIRAVGPSPRIDPRAISHASLILGAMALVRAGGYFFVDRYALELSHDSVVGGAGYTDVHVRLPAMSILALVSLLAFGLLVYNLYQRSLALPVVAVGLWAFVALVLGVIFPAIVQWLEVNPSVTRVELPYIERNIHATREAFNLDSIRPQTFGGHTDLQAGNVSADKSTFNALPLWDPTTAAASYRDLQAERGYYQLTGLSTDRYELNSSSGRVLTPVIVGARELNQASVPRKSWVLEHLEYTHGYGAVLSPANVVSGSSAEPVFSVAGIPSHSSDGAPQLTQPDIYFGQSPGSYVVVNTRQRELDYPTKQGPHLTHYQGSGGVVLQGFWQRAAFALRFHDFNLLVSNLITPQSRIIFNQQVSERVQKAAPFLQVDSNPYPVLANGQIYWMVDCYTTSDYYPYSQGASTGLLSSSSGLQGQYNYVRDSVKAVVNAYTGAVSFYAVDPSDPILATWMHAYPGMIEPMSAMSVTLRNHLRYPQDLLTVLSQMYGRYRFQAKQAQNFYSLDNAWQVASVSPGKAEVPSYELLRLPGSDSLSFVAVEPMVPQTSSPSGNLLTAFLVGASAAKGYGAITAYELPRVSSAALGPELASSKIQRLSAQKVSLGNQKNAQLEPGPTLLVPVDDSLIWVQGLFVSGTDRAFPGLEYVAVDFGGNQVGIAPTLSGALQSIFGSQVTGVGTSSQTVTKQIAQDLELAYAAYQRSVVDGQHFQLGQMQRELQAMGVYLQDAHSLQQQASSRPRPPSSKSHAPTPPPKSGGSKTGTSGSGATGSSGTPSTSGATGSSGAPSTSGATGSSGATTGSAPTSTSGATTTTRKPASNKG
jgi:uncharacterized membrane protein (UPF0182 family)